ncbi:hypothetical protein CAEBREN_25458 [Caenorhabditis brenneri]|uniref:Bestrophin homolog n=1 Tax=Caenorhabditis brenneri TaxID=135651 RepID=G0MYZ8_CAEBE|nr:hypothetical protein CAEBREN_25458 [Caenorhabditis brenneri]
MKYLPLTFMLGFFVTTVFERWRSALNVMPFIESVALSVAVLVPGKAEEDRLIRRAIVRYVVLHQVLVFRDISMRVRRRFPTLQYIVDAGFMEPEERDYLEAVNCAPGQMYWVPINWANSLALDAHQRKLIDQPTAFNNLVLAIKEFRVAMETLIKFDSIPIPIAYPQVVFLAVRVYFTICLVSRQFLLSDLKSKTQMDWPIPIMTILEFIFVIGWMKVAEVLLNPLGEDDDDFEVNWIIDKNVSTGMAIVDDTHGYHPNLVKDKFSDPDYLPAYSEKSQLPRTLTGSAAKVELAAPDDEVKMVRVNPEDSMPTSAKQPDRPGLETLNEEVEPVSSLRRNDRVHSSTSVSSVAELCLKILSSDSIPNEKKKHLLISSINSSNRKKLFFSNEGDRSTQDAHQTSFGEPSTSGSKIE